MKKDVNKNPRIRNVKKYGGSHNIKLEPADLKDFNLKDGDRVAIDDIVKIEDDEK